MRGRKLLSLLLTVAMLLSMLAMPALAEDTTAKSMQLSSYEGTVTITNSTGKAYDPQGQPYLRNGFVITTEAASYAWIVLDGENVVKLDASSSVEIRKSSNELEILLRKGQLFFNVPNPLPAEQKASVTTSNTTTGIRGTAGWITSVRRGHTQVHLLTGVVECTVTDQTSGQRRQATLTAGTGADFYSYTDPSVAGAQGNQGNVNAQDRVDVQFTAVKSQKDIPGFVQVELAKNNRLKEKTVEQTGVDLSGLTPENALAQQAQEQKAALDKSTKFTLPGAFNLNRMFRGGGSDGGFGGSSWGGYHIQPDTTRYTVTWSINGVTESETYAYGEKPAHAAPVVAGKVFKEWSPQIVPVTGNATYTAVFENEYSIMPGAQANGTIAVYDADGKAIDKAPAGSTVTVVLKPAEGFEPYYAELFPLDEKGDQTSDTPLSKTAVQGAQYTYTFTIHHAGVQRGHPGPVPPVRRPADLRGTGIRG